VSQAKEKFESKKLPMMPIRDVVIFPHMMTPFVVGRESSVRALEEALAADKKIFLATQHDASIDEPKPNEIYQVGTIVNIVQSLKLPDGNIKVLVEGVERGKILQIIETEGFMQATVRVVRHTAEPNPQLEAGMQRVTGSLRAVREALSVPKLRDHDRGRANGRSGEAHRHHRRKSAAVH
jgi:ATP-dependent Lon protease